MRVKSEAFTCGRGFRVAVAFVGVCTVLASARPSLAQEFLPARFDYVPRAVDELRQLLGPIALYPDALLAQVLTASTYPDDVISAARWEDVGKPRGTGVRRRGIPGSRVWRRTRPSGPTWPGTPN